MHLRLVFRFLAPAIFCAVRLCHPAAAADKLLFDFQGAADLKAWSQFLPDSPQVPGAKDQFWKETHGSDWDGEDPDFLPIFAAYGPSQGTTNVWDFTQAVKWWTGGKHPNYGFTLHNADYTTVDYLWVHSRWARNVSLRPAMMVIYE